MEYYFKTIGKDTWSNLQIAIKFQSADGQRFDTQKEANEQDKVSDDKAIRTAAKYRDLQPTLITIYTATDGKCWEAENTDPGPYYEAKAYQEMLDREYVLENAVKRLWGNGLTSAEDLKKALMDNPIHELFSDFFNWSMEGFMASRG